MAGQAGFYSRRDFLFQASIRRLQSCAQTLNIVVLVVVSIAFYNTVILSGMHPDLLVVDRTQAARAARSLLPLTIKIDTSPEEASRIQRAQQLREEIAARGTLLETPSDWDGYIDSLVNSRAYKSNSIAVPFVGVKTDVLHVESIVGVASFFGLLAILIVLLNCMNIIESRFEDAEMESDIDDKYKLAVYRKILRGCGVPRRGDGMKSFPLLALLICIAVLNWSNTAMYIAEYQKMYDEGQFYFLIFISLSVSVTLLAAFILHVIRRVEKNVAP